MLAQICIREEKRLERARSLLFEATDFVAQSGRFFVDFLGYGLAQAPFELFELIDGCGDDRVFFLRGDDGGRLFVGWDPGDGLGLFDGRIGIALRGGQGRRGFFGAQVAGFFEDFGGGVYWRVEAQG